jgi:branched-chain amino acid transport system substrate-binding protein
MTRVHGRILSAVLMVLCAYADGRTAEYGLATNLPLSGAWVNYGAGMHNSFKLAVDQANASGKLGDIRLQVIEGDDAGSTAQAVALATKAGAAPSIMGAFCCWASENGIATHSVINDTACPLSSAVPTITAARGRFIPTRWCFGTLLMIS